MSTFSELKRINRYQSTIAIVCIIKPTANVSDGQVDERDSIPVGIWHFGCCHAFDRIQSSVRSVLCIRKAIDTYAKCVEVIADNDSKS